MFLGRRLEYELPLFVLWKRDSNPCYVRVRESSEDKCDMILWIYYVILFVSFLSTEYYSFFYSLIKTSVRFMFEIIFFSCYKIYLFLFKAQVCILFV